MKTILRSAPSCGRGGLSPCDSHLHVGRRRISSPTTPGKYTRRLRRVSFARRLAGRGVSIRAASSRCARSGRLVVQVFIFPALPLRCFSRCGVAREPVMRILVLTNATLTVACWVIMLAKDAAVRAARQALQPESRNNQDSALPEEGCWKPRSTPARGRNHNRCGCFIAGIIPAGDGEDDSSLTAEFGTPFAQQRYGDRLPEAYSQP